MSKVWPHVTAQTPCPICGKSDWCLIGDTKIICMRVESPCAVRSGGWYHEKAGAALRVVLPKREPPKPIESLSLKQMHMRWFARTTSSQLASLAIALSVSRAALYSLEAAWSPEHCAWAFPMKDASGGLIGIRLRTEVGAKFAVPGSRNGLFIPLDLVKVSTLYVCEGPTSLSALLTMGMPAIGRASCQTGADLINEFVKLRSVYRVVVIGDNDRKEKPDGTQWNPGAEGAARLGRELKVRHIVWVPPCKDVRDYLKAGGSRAAIETAIKDKLWMR